MSWASRNIGAARVGIAVMVLFLYGMAMAALATTLIPDGNRDAFSLLLGGLNNALGVVVGYWFNVSRSRTTP